MCGIVGYIGPRSAQQVLLDGLKSLEYRGYDSAGVAILENQAFQVQKCAGKLEVLRNRLEEKPLTGSVGIGHTRWATHGKPTDENAHPHVSVNGRIQVVHNGIIENYLAIRSQLEGEGVVFKTETDTEVIPKLIEKYYTGDLFEAVRRTVNQLRGSYAVAVLCLDEPEKIIAVRKDSPLILGEGEGENFIASDIPAILPYTRKVYILENEDMAVITRDGISLYRTTGEAVTDREPLNVTWNVEEGKKEGWPHFTIKEIHEQPAAIRRTLTGRLNVEDNTIDLGLTSLTPELTKNIDRILITACGTAYYAGMVGKYAIEKLARIPVEADVASEFRYRDPLVNERTLVIIISQSGETADTLAALRECKALGAKVLAITNVVGSSVAREADEVIFTWAGQEIAVASTKAYVTQLVCLYLLALKLAELKGTITEDEKKAAIAEIAQLDSLCEKALLCEEEIKAFCEKWYQKRDMFFIGRGVDYAVALEGALKLKELSYIRAEAYAAGELKHGPIALMEPGVPVLALAVNERLYEKTVSNMKEVAARGASLIGVTTEGNTDLKETCEHVFYLPRVSELFSAPVSVIPLQLLAYYCAVLRGYDVDKPRNLAKSVTVE